MRRDLRPLAKYFLDEDTFTTSLIRILTNAYSLDWLNWLPATIALEIRDDFRVELPPPIFDKICAGLRIINSDAFWNKWLEMNNLSRVLNGSPISFTMFIPATPYDLAWGVTEARFLYPPEADENSISQEVKRFTAATLHYFGVESVPESLKPILKNHEYENLRLGHKTQASDILPELTLKDMPNENDETKQIDEFVLQKAEQLSQQLAEIENILRHYRLLS